MKRIVWLIALLAAVYLFTGWKQPDAFFGAYNQENLIRLTALFGILSLGASFVIMTGGIDLSIGSVVGLTGTLLAWLLVKSKLGVPAALACVALVSLAIGLAHGLLITRLKLQPFVVTLCGLLIVRGIARDVTGDQSIGFGNEFEGLRWLARGKLFSIGSIGIPVPVVIFAALSVAAALFLNRTVWGRHLLATGRNEQAARYSGIRTGRVTLVAYVICALLSGLGGVLFALDVNSVQPAGTGNFYELYAIAAAVLGGCSLRGGEGSILGVAVGAALMRTLNNMIGILDLGTHREFAIIGLVILAGVIADELVRRWAAARTKG